MAKTAGATAKASAKASAKAKAMKSMKAMKSKATASNIKSKKLTIAQLGAQDSETLDDKIARLRASDACPIAIVEQAGRELSKLDRSKVWGQAMTRMKTDQVLAEDYANASGKVEQGRVIMAWKLDPSKGGIYQQLCHTIGTTKDLEKKEKWISWTALMISMSEDEALAHIKSGRVSERECPDTAGIWEFRDNGDITLTTAVRKRKEMLQQQSGLDNPTDEFDAIFDSAQLNLNEGCFDLGEYAWTAGEKGTGKHGKLAINYSKGSGKGSGKSSGKGSGKGLVNQQPKDPVEKDPFEVGMTKAKAAALLVEKVIMQVEADHLDMKSSKYFTKALGKETDSHLASLAKEKKAIKLLIAKKSEGSLDKLKAGLVHAADTIKAAQDFVKEHISFKSSARSCKSKDD